MQKPLSFVGKLFQGLTEDEEESSPPLPPRPSYNDQDLQTLYNMFPNIDPTVCYLVLNANQGVLANSIENLLEISNQQQHR
ncbi:hypothetical protein G6F35_002409 [Rhizopus arrhizus]|nr:hypothetical protein G6F35_002409 [Rhizopus arrhizus]